MSKLQWISLILILSSIFIKSYYNSYSSTIQTENQDFKRENIDITEFTTLRKKYPDVYTQGIFFSKENDKLYLYESGGLYNESSLSKYEFPSLTLVAKANLDNSYFGEGIVKVGDFVYQQTWRERALIKYKSSDLTVVETLSMDPSVTEGWGLSLGPDDTVIATDGSSKVLFLDRSNFKYVKEIETGTKNLNEIRYIGKVNGDNLALCNVYLTKNIVLINLDSGKILKTYNLSKIVHDQINGRPERKLNIESYGECLNGIAIKQLAYNDSKEIEAMITGKKWDQFYFVKFNLEPSNRNNQ